MRMCNCFENVKAAKKNSELNDSFAAARIEQMPPKRATSAMSQVSRLAIEAVEHDEGKKWQTTWNNDAGGTNVANWKKFSVPRKVSGDPMLAKDAQIKEQIRSSSSASNRSNSLTYNIANSRPLSAMDRPASSLDSIQSTLERLKEWCDQGLMDIDEWVLHCFRDLLTTRRTAFPVTITCRVLQVQARKGQDPVQALGGLPRLPPLAGSRVGVRP